MADGGMTARPALAGIAHVGRHGLQHGTPGAVLQERTALQIVSVAARHGGLAAVIAAVRERWRLDLPLTPRRVGDARLAALWSGDQRWLLVAESWPGDLDDALRQSLQGLAAVADQSDGRVVVRIGGRRARDILAKGLAIDLHPRAFVTGDTAIAPAAQIGVQVWQCDDAPTYELAAFRSYAASLYAWLITAGEEFGVDVVADD